MSSFPQKNWSFPHFPIRITKTGGVKGLLCITLILTFHAVTAHKAPIKFGKVDIEDLVQETFLKYHIELRKNVVFKNTRAWLYKVFMIPGSNIIENQMQISLHMMTMLKKKEERWI